MGSPRKMMKKPSESLGSPIKTPRLCESFFLKEGKAGKKHLEWLVKIFFLIIIFAGPFLEELYRDAARNDR